MSRFLSALALVALATAGFTSRPALTQEIAGPAGVHGPVDAAAPGTASAPSARTDDGPATASPSLAFPRSGLSYLPTNTGDERGIEDATSGVWIGGGVGIVAGGLVGSWAYCGLGEGQCGFSITAAGPGMLIGGILGASVGGLLDREPRADDDPVYDEELAASYREELRSYRDQVETTDEEARELAEAMAGSDAFVSTFGSLSVGVIVVDRELDVMAWNRVSEEMWGVPAEEADGVSLEDLEFGLPVEEIRDEIVASAYGEVDEVDRHVEAVNRLGKTIDVRVRIVPFIHDDGSRRGAVILVDQPTG